MSFLRHNFARKIIAIFFIMVISFLLSQNEARAATSFVGTSNLIETNGSAPGAITPNASTANGDLLVFYHYSAVTGGNETVSLPTGFTSVFNSVTANRGLVAVGWRIKQVGDATFTATVTNHLTGGSGETIVEWIETFSGTASTGAIVDFTASLSTWTSSLNIGPISAPATATVTDGDMVVVFGGRFENITGQTVLSGDNLIWATRTLNNTNSGADAAAITQTGFNSSGSNQTVTAKTITTTGTTQAGAGRMFIIKKAPDTTPPTPNPMTFATGPTNDSSTQISMNASTATDASTPPVSYFFTLDNTNCGGSAGTGGTTSSWQAGTNYIDSGLTANKCYGYTIKARDSASTPNETTASGISSTYTSANTPSTPTLGSPTTNTLNLTNAENSNPASNPTTNFAVQVVTTSPSDAVWLNKWIDATGNPSATAVWMTDAQLDALVLHSLQSSTLYGVRTKARNQETDETALSTEGQGTTSAPAPITTISNFVTSEPSNSTIAPEGSALIDSFGLQTSSGTDTITGATVSLASGIGTRVATVAITNNNDTTTYCSVTPSGDTATLIGCGISVNTTNTQFKIKITAIAHTAMTTPPGASYAITGTITAFTSTNAQAGTDSSSATITIDNLSPNGATTVSGSSGNAQVTLNWTSSNSADFNTTNGSVIYRWASSATGSEVPTEGSAPTAGDTNGGATVGCVISSSASTALSKIDGTGGSSGCTTTALTNGQDYSYKVFQKDTNGNYDTGVTIGTFTPSPAPTTTLGNGSDPTANTVAPDASATDVNQFTLQTNTSTETITSITVNLSTASGVGLLAITNSSNTVLGSTASPVTGSNIISVSGMSAGTSIATFKVRATPLSHTGMPAVPGGAYAITAPVTAWVGSFTHTGSDTNSNALTIDNLSPSNASSVSGSAGNAQVTLNWANPVDSDYMSQIILRRAGSAVADFPVEGSSYTAGNIIGTATVVCAIATPTAICADTGLTNGTAYHYKTFSKDSNGNYSTGIVPTNSPFTPSLSTFTLTSSTGAGGTISPLGITNVAQGSDQTFTLTPNLGYDVATIIDNGSPQATTTSYTIGNIQMDHTVAVSFTQITPTYTITSTAGANGTISPLGATILLQGSSQTYTITPISGYVISTLIVDSVSIATTTSHTFSGIIVNHTIDVTFLLIPPSPGTFAITATAGTNGSISPTGVTIVTQGNAQTYTITPASGYSIGTLTVDGASLATTTSYAFTNVQTNHTIDATFIALPAGTIVVTPDTGASRATTVTFSGKAFPGGTIQVVDKTLSDEKIFNQKNIIGEDGLFSISFVGIFQTLHSFGLIVKDKAGRSSQTKFFTIDTRSNDFVAKDILVPPTIDIVSGQVSRGSNALITGYASPKHIVQIRLDGIIKDKIITGKDGSYLFKLLTGELTFGQHKVQTMQIDSVSEKESDLSLSRTFIVSRLSVVKADLSGDGKIDIRDWSIFLSRWISKDSLLKESIDLNGDGKTDITDFSIFIKTIRKL